MARSRIQCFARYTVVEDSGVVRHLRPLMGEMSPSRCFHQLLALAPVVRQPSFRNSLAE